MLLKIVDMKILYLRKYCNEYLGAEIKHRPIALIDKDMTVVNLLTQKYLNDNMISNVRELTTRVGNIFVVVNEGDLISKEF